jgi:hypothetical protein
MQCCKANSVTDVTAQNRKLVSLCFVKYSAYRKMFRMKVDRNETYLVPCFFFCILFKDAAGRSCCMVSDDSMVNE